MRKSKSPDLESLDLEAIKLEFDDRQAHQVYYESQFFFARIGNDTSVLTQFIPLVTGERAHQTFMDGARVRVDGELFIVIDHRWGTLPLRAYGHEPPFEPIFMGVYVHRLYPITDVEDPFPDTLWSDVPGMAHKIPDDDPQLRQVAHGRHITKMLEKKVSDINALMKEGLSETDLAADISYVQGCISYYLRVTLKNVTREHIRGA